MSTQLHNYHTVKDCGGRKLWQRTSHTHFNRKNIGKMAALYSISARIKIVGRLNFGRLFVNCRISQSSPLPKVLLQTSIYTHELCSPLCHNVYLINLHKMVLSLMNPYQLTLDGKVRGYNNAHEAILESTNIVVG